MYIVLFLLGLASVFQQPPAEPKPASELARDMIKATRQLQGLTFTLVKKERVNGKVTEQRAAYKIQPKPYKVYVKQEAPKAGIEVLYVAGTNDNKALVRPNSFPWTPISLSPYGSTMRENQHHTIHEAGYTYLANIIEHQLNKLGKEAKQLVTLQGSVNWNGRDCWKLQFDNPNFTYVSHTVQRNETLRSIAEKLMISEHMILEKNAAILKGDYDAVKPGQVLRIPSDYAAKTSVLIDKQTMLPLQITIADDKGLYEQYEFHNLKPNPRFSPDEFTPQFKSYNF